MAWVSCQARAGRGRRPDADLVRGERHVGRPDARAARRRRAGASPSSGSARPRSGRRASPPRARSRRCPRASATSRSSATSMRRRTGSGSGPKRSMSSWRNAAMSPAERARAEPPVELQLLGLLGHVLGRQVRVHGQVDDGLRHLDDRGATLALGLLLLDRLGQHPRVQVEADRGHVPATARRPGCCRRRGSRGRTGRSGSRRPSSEALKIAWRRLRASSRQPLAAPVQQVGVGPTRLIGPTRPRSW